MVLGNFLKDKEQLLEEFPPTPGIHHALIFTQGSRGELVV